MAQVNIEAVIDHLSSEMRSALMDAVNESIPDAKLDDRELFRAFKRAVHQKCREWESVLDRHVREDS